MGDQKLRLIELTPIEDGRLRFHHGAAQDGIARVRPGRPDVRNEIAAPVQQILRHGCPARPLLETHRYRQQLCQPRHAIDKQAPLRLQIGRTLQGRVTEGQSGERIGISLGIR